jgi:hypothetical protein
MGAIAPARSRATVARRGGEDDMAFGLTRLTGKRRFDPTEQVIRQYERGLTRILAYFGYTIDDIVNDPRKKEHVKRAYCLSRRIGRDLDSESWRNEASERLGGVISRRLGLPEGY